MAEFTGKPICKGASTGRIRVFKSKVDDTKLISISDTDAELKRYEKAFDSAKEKLEKLYDIAREKHMPNADILSAQVMLLTDEGYYNTVRDEIKNNRVNAEYAVKLSCEKYVKIFENIEDETVKTKADDVREISYRLISVLGGEESDIIFGNEKMVIMADAAEPSLLIESGKEHIAGIITKNTGIGSHIVILARDMDIPVVTGIPADIALDGKKCIIDGYKGLVITDPDEKTLNKYENIISDLKEQTRNLHKLIGLPTQTRSGRTVKIYANVSGLDDAEKALQNGAEGIGLFRSEYLFLGRNECPGEDEQFEAYKAVLEAYGDKQVTIRTVDLGADKGARYLNLQSEPNPDLGCRGIRICLKTPDILKTQLRALYRASVYGNLAIMYPMITSVWEVKKLREISAEVREELKSSGLDIGEVPEGILIETPAAALISDELAKYGDFFSIGTNDLTQYALGADRQNDDVTEYYDPRHPAVLSLIKTVIENGHRNKISVGMCGELAADETMTEHLVHLGIDILSVSQGEILSLRKAIREMR